MAALVGRVRELAEIDAAITAAGTGRGRLLLISGPAGIGKSRLADAAAERAADRGLAVCVGHAVDDPGAPPLWPWTRALTSLGIAEVLAGAAPDRLEPDAAARFRLFEAVTERLAAAAPPAGLLLVLEDLHWADDRSVGLLRHLGRELSSRPVAVLVTYRDTAAGPLLPALAGLLRGDDVRALGLTELTADEIASWLPALGSDASVAGAVHERTGGNPLLVRLVAEQLALRPVSIEDLMGDRPHLRQLVVARLAPLSEPARRLVEAAAVVGERLPWPVLAELLDEPELRVRALGDEAAAAGVTTADGGEVRFVHALVRDAVYAELGEQRRGELHRAAAEALAGLGRPELAGSIAFHWRRAAGADAPARCLDWAQRAGEQARWTAGSEAGSYARLAVTVARELGVPDAELARLHLRLAEVLMATHDVAAAIVAAEEAADLAEPLGEGQLLARASLVVQGSGEPTSLRRVRRLCERALAAVPEGEIALRARLVAQLAVCLAEHDEFERAAELAAAALAAARESGDPEARLEAIAARHLTIAVPQSVEERLALGREAVALGAAIRRPMAALWGHLWRTDAGLQLGNLVEARRELAEIDRVARDHGSALARWHHHRYSAVIAQGSGDFAGAERHNRASYELARCLDDFSMIGMYHAFQIHLAVLRGTVDRLDDDWEWFVDAGPPLPLVKVCKVLIRAVSGDRDAARAELAAFRELPDRYPVGPRWYATVSQVGMAAALVDDPEVAGHAYAALLPVARYYSGDGSGGVFTYGANAGLLGDLARVAGRHEQAVRHYADAVAMNDRVGARPFSALSRLGWARSLLALDDELARAAELVGTATAQLLRLDMPGPLATAEATSAAIALARRAGSPLTERETEVARLVADALSNRQVAERLVLSERTVESHVRNILTKLGFSTRTEIATWVVQQQRTAARPD